MSLLTDDLRALIGSRVEYPAREKISHASLRYFALAMGDDNPLYLDDAYAVQHGYPGVIAQPTLIVETCQYAHGTPDERGYLGHAWPISTARFRTIRVGNEYEFFRPVLPDDKISVVWSLESIAEKNSRRGGTQLFLNSVAEYFDEKGELLAKNTEITVLQPIDIDTEKA